jgi:hypothetical protein
MFGTLCFSHVLGEMSAGQRGLIPYFRRVPSDWQMRGIFQTKK